MRRKFLHCIDLQYANAITEGKYSKVMQLIRDNEADQGFQDANIFILGLIRVI